ncbi:MAG: type II toxin-antitoxin system RelE/ParE family toxin [Candidatus Binatia bacterium]
MRIVWSPLAIQRLIEAARYIAQDNPEAAESWAEGLFARIERLSAFPRSGRIVRERGREDTREVIYEKHRIVYRVDATRVLVLTVRNARRLLDLGELE